MTGRPGGPVRDGSAGGREPVFWVGIRAMDGYVRCATRLRVSGLQHIPAAGPALIVANHVSFLDPVVIGALVHRGGRKLRFLAVQEAFEQPVVGRLLRAAHQIPVGTGAERLTAIRRARAMLEAGEVVGIYPQGTIVAAGTDTGAQGGAGLLALTTRAPVIPIATTGLERGAGPRWRRRRAVAVIGRPLDLSPVEGLTGRARYAAAGELMLAAIRDLTPR